MIKEILILTSSLNLGDVGHATAIVKALETEQHAPIVQVKLDTNKPLEDVKKEYDALPLKPNHTLVVGEKGLVALKTLKIDPDNYVIFSSHQYTTELKDTGKKVKHVILPETATIPEGALQHFTKHSFTFAVPTNNPSVEELKAAYEGWQHPLKPALNEDYIVVMLPGDAPDSSNVMKRFSKESSDLLFNNVKKLWEQQGKKHKILLQNGPRTGKYMCSHEYIKGGDQSVSVDEVSSHFVQLLSENGIPHTFFNFAFEMDGAQKKAISVFNQLLYIAQTVGQDNYFIVPGESVSQVGQIPLYLSSEKVIVFKPDSMNADHEKVFQSAVAKNYVSYFDETGNIVTTPVKQKRQSDDAVFVAKEILAGLAK